MAEPKETPQAPFVKFNFRDGQYRCSVPGDQSGQWVSWPHFESFMSRVLDLFKRGALTELQREINEQHRAWFSTVTVEDVVENNSKRFVVVRVEKCKVCDGLGRRCVHVYDGVLCVRHPLWGVCQGCQGAGEQRTEVDLLEALRALGVVK